MSGIPPLACVRAHELRSYQLLRLGRELYLQGKQLKAVAEDIEDSGGGMLAWLTYSDAQIITFARAWMRDQRVTVTEQTS